MPGPATEVGLNVAVTRDGTPEMLRFTVSVNPFNPVIVTVSEPLELRFTVIVAGAEMVKSSGGHWVRYQRDGRGMGENSI